MIEQYQQSVLELKNQLKQLKDFHVQRSTFLANQDALQSKRIKVNDKILDCQDSDQVGKLVKQLETLDHESMLLTAKLDALHLRIDPLEESLPKLLPTIEARFQRLFKTLREHLLAQEIDFTLARVQADKRSSLIPLAEQLALSSISYLELAESQPPNTDLYYTNRPLPSAPQERHDVVQACLLLAQHLLDSADQLLADVNHNPNMVLPPFDLEPPAATAPPGLAVALNTPIDPEEVAYVHELCKQAGKDFDKLTDHDRLILSVSLDTWRKQKLTIGTLPLPPILHQTTTPDLQIEQLRQEGKVK
jgi:hypothetical protein